MKKVQMTEARNSSIGYREVRMQNFKVLFWKTKKYITGPVK